MDTHGLAFGTSFLPNHNNKIKYLKLSELSLWVSLGSVGKVANAFYGLFTT